MSPIRFLGKRRTREHVIADLAVHHVEGHILCCGYVADRVRHDYGYDLLMTSFNEEGEVQPGQVRFQLKATERLRVVGGGREISFSIARADVKLWIREPDPVILVVYDATNDSAFWLHIQDYFCGKMVKQLFAGGVTVNVRIPCANRIQPSAILAFPRLRGGECGSDTGSET